MRNHKNPHGKAPSNFKLGVLAWYMAWHCDMNYVHSKDMHRRG